MQYDEVMCVVCTTDKYVNDFFKSKCAIMVKFFQLIMSDKIKNLNQRWSQTRKSLDTPSSGRQRKPIILEKWFPLQGERAHFLYFFVCTLIKRLETEQQQTYQFTQGYNILHRLQVHHLTLTFIIHMK